MTGMFVKADDPHPVGTTFSFSCRLDDHRPFEGIAEVRWTRDSEDGPDRPTGMGVRFLELDDTSARAVRWLVEKTLHDARRLSAAPQGSSASHLADLSGDTATGPVEAPLGPASQSSPFGASADWREEIRQRRKRRRSLQLAGVLSLVVALVVLWIASPRLRSLATNDDPTAVDVTAEVALDRKAGAAPVPGSTTTGSQFGPKDPPEARTIEDEVARQTAYTAEVEALLEAWVEAWTSQRVDDYLAFYAPAFRPEDLERGAWEDQRRARISSPSFIQVRLKGVNVLVQPGRDAAPPAARATFLQSYRSDSFKDTVLKTLELVRESGRWHIVGESSETIDI